MIVNHSFDTKELKKQEKIDLCDLQIVSQFYDHVTRTVLHDADYFNCHFCNNLALSANKRQLKAENGQNPRGPR